MHSHHFHCMTVNCEVQLHGLSESVAQSVFARLEQQTRDLESKYNFHNPASWLNQHINQRQTDCIALDAQSYGVLQQVQQLSAACEGRFDITVGTLRAALTAAEDEQLQQYQRLRQYMGPQQWRLQDQQLCFANPYCQFDLGGVIKEYAVDQAIRIVREYQPSGALVNFGGDVYALGRKENGKRFKVAVKNPLQPSEMLFAVNIENRGLTTSGHYERQRQLGGQLASHIVGDIAADILSATVISPSVLHSGIYSTALTQDPGLALPKKTAAALVTQTLEIVQRQG